MRHRRGQVTRAITFERTEVKGLGILGGDLAAAFVRSVEHFSRDGRLGHLLGGQLPLHAALERELLNLAAVGGDDILRPALEGGWRGRGIGLHDAGVDGRRRPASARAPGIISTANRLGGYTAAR